MPVHAFDQTIGTMTFALPGLLLAWYLLDGQLAVDFSMTSLWSLLYLSIVASLIGFVAFFYVLTAARGWPGVANPADDSGAGFVDRLSHSRGVRHLEYKTGNAVDYIGIISL